MLKAGYCYKDITPEKRYPMAGYDLRKEANTGVHDPIGCYVLVLDDGESVCVFGAFDLLGVSSYMDERIRTAICDTLPVKPEAIELGAIHTHAAPQSIFRSFDCYDQEYVDFVVNSAIDAAKTAYETRHAVKASYAHTTVRNVGSYRDRVREESAYDMPCDTVYLQGENGEKPILMTVFASHPTVLNEQNFLMSRDLVYGCDRKLKETLGDVDTLFFNGACADASTRYSRFASTYEEVDRLGGIWADAVMASLEEARTLDVTISAKKTIQFMPPADFFTPEERKEIIPYLEQKIENCTDTQQKREWIACRSVLVREHYGTGKGYDAWLSMLSLGDVVFCNTPFEYASVDADVLKARLNEEYGKDFVVCCYSNGYEGYLPSGRKLDRDSGYEDMASNLRSDAKYLVADAFSAMAGTL